MPGDERFRSWIMGPAPHRVAMCWDETPAAVTLRLAPLGRQEPMLPGQFCVLHARAREPVPAVVSAPPGLTGDALEVTAWGATARALASPGTRVGVTGPFGTGWDLEAATGRQVLLVARSLGLAALRPVVLALRGRPPSTASRPRLYVTARRWGALPFRRELGEWADRLDVTIIIGHAEAPRHAVAGLGDASAVAAMIAGPLPVLRATATALVQAGVHPGRIQLSAHSRLLCADTTCGRCRIGPLLSCRVGPVLTYAQVAGHW